MKNQLIITDEQADSIEVSDLRKYYLIWCKKYEQEQNIIVSNSKQWSTNLTTKFFVVFP